MTDLVNVSQALAELELTEDQIVPVQRARIEQLIRGLSAAVRSYTGNKFGTGDYVETFDGNVRSFNVLNRPINSVTEIADVSQSPAVVQDPTSYGIDYPAGLIFPANQMKGFAFDFQENQVPAPDDLEVSDLGRQRWRVSYNAGNSIVPDDVQLAVLQWISAIKAVTPGLLSERIGDYAYSTNEVLQQMPGFAKGILDDYRGSRIRIA